MRSDIVPGKVFPDYELPDHTDTLRRLSELQGDDPLILTLARGHYCPKEHQQHLELAAFYERLLGWRIAQSAPGGWALLESPEGLKIEIQGLADYQPPTWPNAPGEQQMMLHLDFATDDLDAAVEWAIEVGATVAEYQPQPHVKVMLDPAGHPFCLFRGAV
jgi:predicted enzyme related to lactoylglutathione lyase